MEEVLVDGDPQQVSLGDFVPHTLVYLEKNSRSRLWVVGYLCNQTYRQDHTFGLVDPMHPRESFALAWLFVSRGLLTSWSQAITYLRTLYRNKILRLHHHDQQEG